MSAFKPESLCTELPDSFAGRWVGQHASLVDAILELDQAFDAFNASSISGDVDGSVTMSGGPIIIRKGARIHAHVHIEGPVYIGEGASIRAHSVVRQHAVIGNGCVVGRGSEIKHSVLLDHAKIASNAFVGDSVLGMHARVGSGAITANRRFDQDDIFLLDEKLKAQATGLQHFGALIGECARLGANVTLAPGTVVEPYAWINSGLAVHGRLPGEHLMLTKTPSHKRAIKPKRLSTGKGDYEET